MPISKELLLETELIDNFKDFLSLDKVWNNLLEKSPTDTVFLRHEWFNCWWKSLGKQKQLFIILVKKKEKIIGIAPLMISREPFRRILVRKVKFVADDNSFRCNFIIDNQDSKNRKKVIEAIIDYIYKKQEMWDIVELENIPSGSFTSELIDVLASLKDKVYGIKRGLISPYIYINTNWDNYFSNRPKRLHKNIKNKSNRLSQANGYAIEEIKQSDNTLSLIFEISAKSWKAREGKAITQLEERRDFFTNLSKIASSQGWLSIWLLKINNEPVAYEYQLKYKDTVCALRGDFKEDYKEYSPGSILEYYVIKHTIISNNNIKEYDLGGGCDFYKTNWTSNLRTHSIFLMFKYSFLSLTIYFLEFKIILPIKRKIHPLRAIYKKTRHIYKYEGLKRLLYRGGGGLFKFLFSINSAIWFKKKLAEHVEFKPNIPVEIYFDSLNKTLEWLANQKEKWLINPKETDIALKNNHYFPTVYYKGELIGCLKIGFKNVYIVDFAKIMTFPKDMAFIYDTYILPKYRGKGIAPYLIAESLKFLRLNGFKRVGCHIPPWNTSSIKVYTKVGFQKVNYVKCFRIAGIKIFTSNPIRDGNKIN
ncbi:MAG: GNAT family N-acetyltransferase [bacterium]